MVPKHVAFAPASQKQLGSRLRSPLLRRETMPAQPFSRFFHHIAFAKQGNLTQLAPSMSEHGAIKLNEPPEGKDSKLSDVDEQAEVRKSAEKNGEGMALKI